MNNNNNSNKLLSLKRNLTSPLYRKKGYCNIEKLFSDILLLVISRFYEI